MATRKEAAAESAAATVGKSQSITRKKMSPQEQLYLKAIAMSSAELGAAIRVPTERIAQHVGNALAHDLEAKKERDGAQREFQQNIAFYYEVKQRLLNPGYRTDVDGAKDRTPDENERNFGAPDWATFASKCLAYSLQHADRKLKAFAKLNGLLTDEGENIDDPEPNEGEGAGRPQPRRTEDPTAQRRYEFIATAAMDIASRNPEGEVEKQILAAAEYKPTPLMPISPDLFTEVLSFITRMSSSAADEGDRAEAKQLVNKMRLHKPAPQVAKVPAEAAEEEKRKRDRRLARKNGQPLGSAACSPPANGTSEHVQRFAAGTEGKESTPPEKGSKEYRLRKTKAQRDYYQRKKHAKVESQAATPAAQQDAGPLGVANQDAPQPAAAPAPKQGMSEEAMRTPSKAAPEPPSGRAGVPTTGAARRRKMAKYEYPLSDLEIIEEWSKTNWGTAKDIVAQCPDLAEKRVKKVGEMCEQLVAEGRLKATDAPGLHYIGQAGEYYRELRKKGVREVWTGSGNSRQRVLI